MERKYVAIRNSNIVNMFNQGMPVEDIADVVNTSLNNTLKILRENGVTFPRLGAKVDKEKLVDMRNNGASVKEIAEAFNCTTATISHHLKSLGMGCFSYKLVTPAEVEAMLDMRNKGYTNSEIARKFGRSVDCVIRHIGHQPEEITAVSFEYRALAKKLNFERRNSARIAMIRKREEEARIEQERIEAEKREQARIAKENEIRNMLSGFGISMDDFHISSAEHGDSILDGLRRQLNIA